PGTRSSRRRVVAISWSNSERAIAVSLMEALRARGTVFRNLVRPGGGREGAGERLRGVPAPHPRGALPARREHLYVAFSSGPCGPRSAVKETSRCPRTPSPGTPAPRCGG